MINLFFLKKYGFPQDVIDHITSYFTEKDLTEFSEQFSKSLGEKNIDDIKLFHALGIKIIGKEAKNKLDDFLLESVKENKIQTTKLLLDIGVDVETPEKLLNFRAEVTSGSYGATNIFIVSSDNLTEKLEYKPLDIAIMAGNVDMVKLLLSKNVDVNSNVYGLFQRYLGSYNSNRGFFQYYGSLDNLNQIIGTYNFREVYKSSLQPCSSPLRLALEKNHTEIIKLLIENGANIHSSLPDTPSYNNNSYPHLVRSLPIDLAAHKKNFEIVEILLEKGVFHRVRGAISEPTESDLFIAFVEQEIERKQRKEMLSKISKLTEQLLNMDRKIQNLSQTVQQLIEKKDDPSNKKGTNVSFFNIDSSL